MIVPYAEGPMEFSGAIWYQGEANTKDAASALLYACTFPQMLRSWRRAIPSLQAFFSFAQLSTWCTGRPANPSSIPQMRDAQLSLTSEARVAWATNADHGYGCDIHPRAKQAIGKRLARGALAVRYKLDESWLSPTYGLSLIHI